MKQLPPTAVEIVIAEGLTGTRLAEYLQLNCVEFGGLACDLTGNDEAQIQRFAQLMIEAFYQGVESFREDQLDTPDGGKLASILTTQIGKIQ
jgi:Ni,Fe-hydrogenase III large subunit